LTKKRYVCTSSTTPETSVPGGRGKVKKVRLRIKARPKIQPVCLPLLPKTNKSTINSSKLPGKPKIKHQSMAKRHRKRSKPTYPKGKDKADNFDTIFHRFPSHSKDPQGAKRAWLQ